ncbi:MAG: DUF1573 domain-containing protein [Muribaculaceae bacterium]|nr:DUF1573 domain-containing protein [Muribaculaceae bacterium]
MKTISRRFFSVLIIALLALTAAARQTPGDKVGADIDSLVYNFGIVADNAAPVSHDFIVSNKGTSAIAILSVKPRCGCTVGNYSRKPVKPGKSTPINIKFNPAGQRGEVDKSVRVRLKNGDGKSEEITLRMVGQVVPHND